MNEQIDFPETLDGAWDVYESEMKKSYKSINDDVLEAVKHAFFSGADYMVYATRRRMSMAEKQPVSEAVQRAIIQ